jgi:hypothetical protein
MYIFFIIFLISSAWSKENSLPFRVTKCLGKEEARLHKQKIQDVDFVLNQMLITEFVQFQYLTLTDSIYQKACTSDSARSSVIIFKEVMTKGEKAFLVFGKREEEKGIAKALLTDFSTRLPKIFNNFLLNIEKEAPTSDCFKKEIPELKELYVEMQHLEPLMGFQHILQKNNRFHKIMDKLDNYPALIKKCQQDSALKSEEKNSPSGL